LRHAAAADPEELDLVVERRVLAIVQGPDHVVGGGEIFVAVSIILAFA